MPYDHGTRSSLTSASTGHRKNDFPPFLFVPSDDGRIPIRLYLRIIWNRRWIILAGTLAIVIAVGIKTVKQKPVYKAKGTLEIEMPKQSVTNIQDFVSAASVPDSYLQTQAKIVSSGQTTRQVMDEIYPPNPSKPSTPDARWAEESSFQKRLDVQVMKGSQLIEVCFESGDPAIAAQVVNRLMSRYIDQIQAMRSETAIGASSWLMDRVTEAKAKLDQSMEALHSFERQHQLLQVDPNRERLMNIDSERLEQLQKQLTVIEAAKMEKELILKHLQAGDTQAVHSSLLEDNLKTEADLEAQLAKLSSKFGPKFPEVQHLEAQLTEVRSIVENEHDRLSREVEAEYQAQASEEVLTQREIGLLRAKLAGGSDQLMQDSILKRDVDLNEQEYESLLQKLQEVSNTASLKNVNARVVDAAAPPAASSYPGLVRNLLLSVLIGLVGGVVGSIAEEPAGHNQDSGRG